ncbi:uncharacterized protein LOC124155716 [Ischnura elegans]|uniref:uncharacterized protein LOC124155716 n=1 Tax=Ischnura elegans TaxID=197161 RepID=UPI001ED8A866|nr:uncharacterized protein LOC124155716 [Ischnura elegans]
METYLPAETDTHTKWVPTSLFDSMTMVFGKLRNPELEAIRNSVKPPPNNDSRIDELIRKTRDIHVSFLFSPEGTRLRKELCLTLSSTKPSPFYSGWEDFGHHLGLDPRIVNFSGIGILREDPTFYVVRAYADTEHGTIANLIVALRNIGRPDIITKNYDLFIEFSEEIHRKYRSSEESGYLSVSEGTVDSSNGSSEEDIQHNIIRYPYNLPAVPSILSLHSVQQPERCTQINIQVQHQKQEDQLIRAAPINIKTRVPAARPQYGIKVMLTFASDGYEIAKEVAKTMREKREGLPRIGVLILQEQQAALAQDDQSFIAGAFQQVDYVIPIITREYIQRILNVENDYVSSTCVDDRYVRYIYVLMNTNYINNGCSNKKCTCIIPDEIVHSMLKHPKIVNEPLFKVWHKVSGTEELCKILLQATIRRRNLAS